MYRSLLAGVAAVALLSGAAHAQDSTTYYNRTHTVTTPFGYSSSSSTSQSSSSSTTTTTTEPMDAQDDDAEPVPPPPPVAEIPPPPPPPGYQDEQSAEIMAPPPPGSAPAPIYEDTPVYRQDTTTRRVDPYGNEMERTDRVERHRSFSDEDGSLGAHTTTQTRSTVTNYAPPERIPVAPPPVYTPSGSNITVVLPGGSTTTTTTTTTDDGDE